jgi:hypothetical protein
MLFILTSDGAIIVALNKLQNAIQILGPFFKMASF